jgi:hypothetical protein
MEARILYQHMYRPTLMLTAYMLNTHFMLISLTLNTYVCLFYFKQLYCMALQRSRYMFYVTTYQKLFDRMVT